MNDTPHSEPIQATPVAHACDPTPPTAEENALQADATADPCRPPEQPDAAEETAGPNPSVFEDPCADPDPDCGTADATAAPYGLDELRGELIALREELASERARHEREARDYEEFCRLYPDVPLASCSDAVWRAVENGTPLAAAYALEERRRALTAARAAQANEQNKQRSSGRVKDAQSDFFTPDEVRSMSQNEVRANLSRIMQSMKKW